MHSADNLPPQQFLQPAPNLMLCSFGQLRKVCLTRTIPIMELASTSRQMEMEWEQLAVLNTPPVEWLNESLFSLRGQKYITTRRTSVCYTRVSSGPTWRICP